MSIEGDYYDKEECKSNLNKYIRDNKIENILEISSICEELIKKDNRYPGIEFWCGLIKLIKILIFINFNTPGVRIINKIIDFIYYPSRIL